MWIIYCSYFKYVVILYSTDTDIAWVIYFLFLENLCFLPSMVGSRNGFSKLVLAIMRGRGRVQAGSRTTLPTRLTTLNILHCITIKHSADTNTDNHTTLSVYVFSCSCQITISKFPCCSPSHLINSIFLGGQKLGKNGLNQAERWQNIHFSSYV